MPDEVLVQWLNEVDQTIFKELVKTHEYGTELVFGGYDRTDESGADSVVPVSYTHLYRIREWYGCTAVANEGVKLDPQAIAAGIREIERTDPNLAAVSYTHLQCPGPHNTGV